MASATALFEDHKSEAAAAEELTRLSVDTILRGHGATQPHSCVTSTAGALLAKVAAAGCVPPAASPAAKVAAGDP